MVGNRKAPDGTQNGTIRPVFSRMVDMGNRPQTHVVFSRGMTEKEAIDLKWIGTCSHHDAEEAERILGEVLVQFDRGNLPITINPRCTTRGGFRPLPEQHDALVRWRQEVMTLLTRRRIFQTSHYFERGSGRDGECFTVETEEALVRRAHELFQARVHGQALTGVLSWQPMSSAQAPLTWLGDIPTDILNEARDILEAAVRELALGKTTMRVSPFPSEYDQHPPPVGQDERLKAGRTDVAEMLVRRGVLRGQRSVYVGGPYAREEDRGDWLTLDADPTTIRHALEELHAHLRGRDQYQCMPQNMRSALPTPKWVSLPPGNVHNYYGITNIATVTSTGDHNTVTVTVGPSDLKAITDLVAEVKGAVDKLGLDVATKQEVEAEIATIEAQARSSKPKPGILKTSLSALGSALASAAVREVAGPLIHRIALLLPHPGGH